MVCLKKTLNLNKFKQTNDGTIEGLVEFLTNNQWDFCQQLEWGYQHFILQTPRFGGRASIALLSF